MDKDKGPDVIVEDLIREEVKAEALTRIVREAEEPSWWKKFTLNFISDLKWEISFYLRKWFYYPYRNVVNGVSNLIKYWEIIWNDRWFDYSFLLELLLFKLKDMQKHWGVDTHYVNDKVDREIIDKLIEDLEWMLDTELEFDDGYEEEYNRRSRSFFGRLNRHHRKLWD